MLREIEFQAAVRDTDLGWIVLAWREEQLYRLSFGHRSAGAARLGLAESGLCFDKPLADAQRGLLERVQNYASGAYGNFQDVLILQDDLTDFQRRIIRFCREIPYGETCSYAELARHAGHPRAARAVGNVMARNRTPLIVPCHRVVATGEGCWGGFGAIGGVRTKKKLLEMEQSVGVS